MKGFTISGGNGPIVTVAHRTGEHFSKVAALHRIRLPATDACKTCGYRKVEKAKLAGFFTEIGKLGSSAVAQTTVATVLEALENEPAAVVELIDDYVWCETHARL